MQRTQQTHGWSANRRYLCLIWDSPVFTIRQKALVRDGLRKGVLALVPVLEAGESPIFAREIVEPHHLHHCSLLHASWTPWPCR